MFRVAVCDDDPPQSDSIISLLNRYNDLRPGLNIHPFGFTSAYDLLTDAATNSYDLYLLDILMPELSGIELATKLLSEDKNVPLVFLTSSADYALDAYSVCAIQYLLKPVGEDALFPVLDRILSAQRREDEQFFMVATPHSKTKVLISRIVCVESVGRTLCLRLDDGSKIFSKTIRVPFERAVGPLLENSRFLHAHKSFLLNMDFVEKITKNEFIMQGGFEVPVPRYKYSNAKIRYMDYLSKRGIGFLGGGK